MLGTLSNHVGVITGAGSGLGRETALLAAQTGMRLALVDKQAPALAETQVMCQAHGATAFVYQVDVSRAADMDDLAQAVARDLGVPHWVFNNAGVSHGGLVWEHSAADWDWLLGVNLMGVVHGVRVFTPMMLAAAKADALWRGHITNTASMAGLLTPPNMGIYNVSKHGVVALTETLYHDLRLVTDQVGVSLLCPYYVPTGIAHSAGQREQPLTTSQQIGVAQLQQAVQRGKVSAAEVAAKVLQALSTDAFYIYSHPNALGNVQERHEAITAMRPPPDPFAARPEIGQRLRQQLRGDQPTP